MRDPITLIFSDFSVINNCEVPNGMMTMGNYYRVVFVAYDPYGEYSQNVTKYSSINLVSSPVSDEHNQLCRLSLRSSEVINS